MAHRLDVLISSFAAASLLSLFRMAPAVAGSVLTSAKVYDLASQVHLQKSKGKLIPTKRGDVMVPLDFLKTGTSAWAKLHFNEGTLFRVNPNAKFWFLPNTRSFQLQHGLILSMIQPEQGITTILTPTANIATFGTALIVRHDQTQETTLIGALTHESSRPIFVNNPKGEGRVKLLAGQQVEITKGVVGSVEDFNLPAFYRACELSAILDPAQAELAAQEPPEVQAPLKVIRAETAKALAEQQAQPNPPPVSQDGASLCAPVSELPKDELPKDPGNDSSVGGGVNICIIPIPFLCPGTTPPGTTTTDPTPGTTTTGTPGIFR
jgi:FecR protein